jgi:hypothetical protein
MEPLKWIAAVLRELAPIRPGVTRADVERVMKRDGGIFVPLHSERYVLRSCDHVKLDVEFEQRGGVDIVRRVSKPYLERPFMD